MQIEPHIALTKLEAGSGYSSFFGLKLDSIGSEHYQGEERQQYLARLLNRQVDFISTLPGMGAAAAIELRLVSYPVASSPHRGRVDVFLRIRVHGDTKEEAEERALAAYNSVWPNLIAISDIYHWAPIESAEGYDELFLRADSPHIGELVRREAKLQLDRVFPWPIKRSIGYIEGVQPEPDTDNDGCVYLVFPFLRTISGLQRFFNILLFYKNPVVISLGLAPTVVRPIEYDYLRTQIERCELFLQRERQFSQETGELIPALRDQAQSLLHMLQQSAFSLLDDCFLMKVQVASSEPIHEGLMEALGVTITEPVGGQGSHLDARSSKDFLSGGYDWMQPGTKDDQATALHNLDNIEFKAWSKTVVPGEVVRIRYLTAASEANSVFRFPIPGEGDYPGIETRLARTLQPPTNIPDSGLYLGDNLYRGYRERIKLLPDDRRRHMYMVGQTGTGKSSLLLSSIVQDICNGEGVCVLDPHGELVDGILPLIPENRLDDVIYFDPTNQESIIGLNLLEFRDSLDKESAVNHLLEIFYELYDVPEAFGPVFEQYFRNSAYLALDGTDNEATLADIQRVFVDREYRREKIKLCTNPFVRSFWEEIAGKASGDLEIANLAAYVTSKFSRFIYNDLMRPIILQKKSSVNFYSAMNQRKIILVDLAKGKLGSTNSRFLGMILLSLIERAAFARSEISNSTKYPDFYLYVDEFQNLATEGFIDMLSEARKYKLNLIVTNQYIHQIPDAIREAVLGNVGTLLSFRVGLQDAEMLEKQYSTIVTKHDLMGLSNYESYMTTLFNGEATLPFSVRTRLYDGESNPDTVSTVKKLSARKYGLSKEQIEQEIESTLIGVKEKQ